MLEHNQNMQNFLKRHGIDAVPFRIDKGSMRGTWRLVGKANRKSENWHEKYQKWTPELEAKLNGLGFLDYDGKTLHKFSGNGGTFCVFVRSPQNWQENKPALTLISSTVGQPTISREVRHNIRMVKAARANVRITKRNGKPMYY